MTRSLDVLVLESHPHAGDEAVARLEAAGHAVHRCHEAGSSDSFPCAGLTDAATCPLTDGVDVAVDVRGAGAADATAFEDGVGCALRAGVPVVEVGTGGDSPFGAWTFAAAVDDLPAACEVTADARFQALEAAISEQVAHLAGARGVDTSLLSCAVSRRGRGVRIVLSGPRVTPVLQQAFSVLAFGVVRDTTRVPHEEISIAYATVAPPG